MRHRAITLEVLAVIDAIDRRGSFAKAAEELGKATSALSYAIQKLEEQLGISLFQRRGRRSVLTPAGKLLLDDGRMILAATQQLTDKAIETATGWEPRIRIALESILDSECAFQAIAKFSQEHPNIELDICESILNGTWEALERDQVDLVVGASGTAPPQSGIRALPLSSQSLVAVVASHHPLAKSILDGKPLDQLLANCRRVISHDTAQLNVRRDAGLNLGQSPVYVQTIEQKQLAIKAGIGIGHLPPKRVQPLLERGELVAVPLRLSERCNQNIAWKVNHKGRGLKALIAHLVRAFQ